MVFKKSILSVVCAVGVCGVVQGADGRRTPERRQPQSFVPPNQKAVHAHDKKAVAFRLLKDLYADARRAFEAGNFELALAIFRSLDFKIVEYNHDYAPMVTVAALAAAYRAPVEHIVDAMDIETDGEVSSTGTESDGE